MILDLKDVNERCTSRQRGGKDTDSDSEKAKTKAEAKSKENKKPQPWILLFLIQPFIIIHSKLIFMPLCLEYGRKAKGGRAEWQEGINCLRKLRQLKRIKGSSPDGLEKGSTAEE